jgi:Lrp/AsnC family leucine-responsive transcriptional regulator
MTGHSGHIDEMDRKIIGILQKNCWPSLDEVSKNMKIPKTTLHYRIKKLEREGIIAGYHAKIDPSKVGKDFVTLTFVRAKYGPGYHKKVGQKLARIPGVWAVYFIFGEIDFVVMTRSSNSQDFLRKIETMQNMGEILSTNTHIVAQVIKEDEGIEVDSSVFKEERAR